MVRVIEDGGVGGSNLVSGEGTNSATFTMPDGVALAVESVVATVDNTAGADTTAQLTIQDQSGQVIATKRQGEAVAAGDTGTATFALRTVDDRNFVRATLGSRQRADFFSQHTITAGNNWAWEWVQQDGPTTFLDLTDPFQPVVRTSGVYAVTAVMIGTVRTPGQTGTITIDADFGAGLPLTAIPIFVESDFPLQGQPNAPAAHVPAGTACAVWYLDKGSHIDAIGWHSNAADRDFRFFGYVQRIT